MDEGATDGVTNNPSAQLVHMSRPSEKATIGRENYKRIEEPRPYMDEEYLKKSTQQIRWTSLPRWSRPSWMARPSWRSRPSLLRMDESISLSDLGNFHSGYGSYSQFSGFLDIGNGY